MRMRQTALNSKMVPLAVAALVCAFLVNSGAGFVANREGLEIGESIRIGYATLLCTHRACVLSK
jgi:hypothetical protein